MYVTKRKASAKPSEGRMWKLNQEFDFPRLSLYLFFKCSTKNGSSSISPELPWPSLDDPGVGMKGIFFSLGWWIYGQSRNICSKFSEMHHISISSAIQNIISWFLDCVRPTVRPETGERMIKMTKVSGQRRTVWELGFLKSSWLSPAPTKPSSREPLKVPNVSPAWDSESQQMPRAGSAGNLLAQWSCGGCIKDKLMLPAGKLKFVCEEIGLK